MEKGKNEIQKTAIEIPDSLKGYGIEEGLPDYDRLDEHGKLDQFRRWEQEQLRNNPQPPKSQKCVTIKKGVRKAVRRTIPINCWQTGTGLRVWN